MFIERLLWANMVVGTGGVSVDQKNRTLVFRELTELIVRVTEEKTGNSSVLDPC